MMNSDEQTAEVLNKLEQVKELSTLQYKKGKEVMNRKVMVWANEKVDVESDYIASLDKKLMTAREKTDAMFKLEGKVEILTDLLSFLNELDDK